MSVYMAMISLHKIEWVIKYKLLTSNRDLKLKLIKLKKLSSFYMKISTLWERERERIITNGVKMVPTCRLRISMGVRIKLNEFFFF